MKDYIEQITLRENMTLLTVSGFPSGASEMADFFSLIAEQKINLDMISQTAPYGGLISISITFTDVELNKIFGIIAKLKEKYPNIKTDVTTANQKLLFSSEKMRDTPGVTAYIFKVIASLSADVKLITTSDIEVSLLINHPHIDELINGIEKEMGIKVVNY